MQKRTSTNNLIIARRELAFQKNEKGKRADELIVANIELAYQNKEKGKRAEELIVANKELVFQNEEKGKRADELMIANRELKKAEADIRNINIQLKAQYDKLLKVAFLQSHQVRVPIANILGLFNLFEFENPGDPINGKVLQMLKLVAESLDTTIHEITQNTNEIRKVIKT